MKIKGTLTTDKTKAELDNILIPSMGTFEKLEDEDKPIIHYRSLTSREYSREILSMGIMQASKIDFAELSLPRITKIEKLELEDGTKIENGEQLGSIIHSRAVIDIITELGYKLINESAFDEEETKN